MKAVLRNTHRKPYGEVRRQCKAVQCFQKEVLRKRKSGSLPLCDVFSKLFRIFHYNKRRAINTRMEMAGKYRRKFRIANILTIIIFFK